MRIALGRSRNSIWQTHCASYSTPRFLLFTSIPPWTKAQLWHGSWTWGHNSAWIPCNNSTVRSDRCICQFEL